MMKRSPIVAAVATVAAALALTAATGGGALAATHHTVTPQTATPATVRPATIYVNNFAPALGGAVSADQKTLPIKVSWTNNPGTLVRSHILQRAELAAQQLITLEEVLGNFKTPQSYLDQTPIAVGFMQYQMEARDLNNVLVQAGQTYNFTPEVFDDTNAAVHLSNGPWTKTTLAGTTLGHYSVSTAANATITFNTCAKQVAIIATTGPAGGTAKVLVKGLQVGTINYLSSVQTKRVVVWSNTFSPTQSCLPIEIIRTTGRINIDAVEALG